MYMKQSSINRVKRILFNQPLKVIVAKANRRLWMQWRYIKARLTDTVLSDYQLHKALDFDGSLQEYVRYAGRRSEVRFFVDTRNKELILKHLRQEYHHAEALVIEAAEKICQHRFDLLGSGEIYLGNGINWHSDFKTDRTWPLKHYSRIDVIQSENHSDVKVPWELSRCYHFITLGKAYWYTDDERYAQEWLAQMDSWIRSNPIEFGINWTCAMEVAIRLVNWIWTYYFFYDSPSFTYKMRIKFLKSLLAHCRFIFTNLENLGIRNNHYLANLVGLIYAGTLFSEFKEAKVWSDFALAELLKEINHQFYPDGVNFEASISYHRLSLELIFSAILLVRLNDIEILKDIKAHLNRMFEFIMGYTKPDGSSPQVGDSDDGRLHILSEYTKSHSNDHRYLLAIGAVLFERTDLGRAATRFWEEAFWLLGKESLERFERLEKTKSSPKSHSFKDSGIYIVRKDDLYMIIDAGGNGQDGAGGHAHNDIMSFELYAHDKTFIIDPGTYAYTGDLKMRNEFRSTKFHNTLVVDDEEINRINKTNLFFLNNDASVQVTKWKVTNSFDFFEGYHTGYTRLKKPILHRRQIYFNKEKRFWILRDILTGKGTHKADVYFHFTPLKLESYDKHLYSIITNCEGANLQILPLETKDLSVEIFESWVSSSYGKKQMAPVAKYAKLSQLPISFTFAVLPTKMNEELSIGYIEKVLLEDEYLPILLLSSLHLGGEKK